MAQGGDFTKGNGPGCCSIYGVKFNDENLSLNTLGVLSMANSGPNTSESRFFTTTAATDWLDRKHVVFGKIVEGLDVLEVIANPGSSSGTSKVEISESGKV
jgi:peptidylprolyl isomerase